MKATTSEGEPGVAEGGRATDGDLVEGLVHALEFDHPDPDGPPVVGDLGIEGDLGVDAAAGVHRAFRGGAHGAGVGVVSGHAIVGRSGLDVVGRGSR